MMEALSPANIGLLLFGIFFVLLLIGSPIMVALGVATMACFIVLDIDLSLMIERAFASLTAFPLMALPAFVLAGSLMEAAGVSRRLVHVAENIVGPTPGGLAISTTLSCVFFGAISGSGPATTAAVGMLMIPAMAKRGYNVGYAAAATATAGGIGIIIPPSIPMVIYGVSGQQSISKMFMAGIIPGILIAIGLSVMHFFLCRNLKTEGLDWSMKTFIHSLRDGFWSILAPVIILGGIYSGMLTATESAAVAVVWAAIAGLFIYKELTFKELIPILKDSAKSSAMILFIIASSTAFSWVFTFSGASQALVNAVISMHLNSALFCFVVAIILLIFGTFMEGTAIAVLLVPVLWPIAQSMGIDVIHFGMIVCISNVVGTMTPPVAVNIFSASTVSGLKMGDIAKAEIPFLIGYVAVFFCCVFSETFCTFLI